MTTTTNVATLKARLSEFLRQVKAGRDVIVTDRGVPVARLSGLEAQEHRNTRRVRLVRSGVLKPGRAPRDPALLTPPGGAPIGREVLDALVTERSEGR